MSDINDFFKWDDVAKRNFIESQYANLSCNQIAKQIGTYSKKVEREAKRLGIKIRSKSEAQKLAYSQGTKKHPTKGTKRSEDVKRKISATIGLQWENMDGETYAARSKISKENWEQRSDDSKRDMEAKRLRGVQHTAIVGSKMERAMADLLRNKGYAIEQHKKNTIVNQDIHLDIYLPQNNIAIEVDGPSHNKDVWGKDCLRRQQKTDREKDFLLRSKGIHLIRIIHIKKPSKYRIEKVGKILLDTIDIIKKRYQQELQGQLFVIED